MDEIRQQLDEMAKAMFMINQSMVVTSFVVDYIIEKTGIDKEDLFKVVGEKIKEWEQQQVKLMEEFVNKSENSEQLSQ